jgi:amyloid beta (A4) precursor protein-binding family B protein 2 (Fe65-like)
MGGGERGLVVQADENRSRELLLARVWGVGRDNCKDFAYVSRDKQTRKHMCHVFR